MPHVLLVNIIGPSGEQLPSGALVPDDWDGTYVAALVKEGAVGEPSAWDKIVERNKVEAEARIAEPPLPAWSPPPPPPDESMTPEQRATREEVIANWPPPPQVPDAVRKASKALLDAPAKGVAKAAEALQRTVVEVHDLSPQEVERAAEALRAQKGSN